MTNDNNDFLLKPSKSVEEFTAKQAYISERLNEQQQPSAKSWLVLWCLLRSLLTAAVIIGVIIVHELMEANQLKERGAASTPAPTPAVSVPEPEPNQVPQNQRILFESKDFGFMATFPGSVDSENVPLPMGMQASVFVFCQ